MKQIIVIAILLTIAFAKTPELVNHLEG